ncbi:predicted protein [Nematostella vectensis]|uniref:Uncharacterized protein n=1 Tax=Nematostella vectensis TaxID=45351 RepID=A8DWV4_NEMVE|nr:predicted protein [Nematostella vectensis]|eukprot:XP_001617405.1 hypothetical protein NEMVEDRAFT_v1g157617 [Nematostella vectensis]
MLSVLICFLFPAYGVRTDGVTTYINASTANVRYKAVNRPVVFDLPTSVAA